jgi:hypothetical protein
VRWSFGAVPSGALRRFTFTARVADGVAPGTVLTPAAAVRGGGASLARATAATEVRPASPLRLTVSADRAMVDAVNLGTTNDNNCHAAYEYRIANTGGEVVQGLVLSDLAYAGFRSEPWYSGAPDCTGDTFSHCLTTWPAFDLQPGEVKTLLLVRNPTTETGSLLRAAVTLDTPFGRLAQQADAVGAPDGLFLSMATTPTTTCRRAAR